MAHFVAETAADGASVEAGSWGSISLIYIYAVVAGASVTKLMPLTGELERAFNASPKSVGFAIGLASVSSLVAATIGGVLIDRVGARASIIFTCIIAVVANIIGFFATSLFMVDVARLIEGVEFIGIVAAAPALMMSITSGARRIKAMSLCSTYITTGGALGLLLAAPFAENGHWRGIFAVHGAIFAVAACFGWLLPKTPRIPASKAGSRIKELLAIYREVGPLRLSLSFGLIGALGLGTTTVLPRYLAQTHHISISAASSLVAFAHIAWIVGSILGGFLLSRKAGTSLIYPIIASAAIVSGFLLYAPWVSLLIAIAALLVLLLAQGAGLAVIWSLLPHVVRDTRRGGAGSALMMQVLAVGALFTPSIFLSILAKGQWMYFVVLVLAGWTLSLVFLPSGSKANVSGSLGRM
jgi:predicted MFS family arabinose efflux permease